MSDHSELLVSKWAEQAAIPQNVFSINYKSDADSQDTYIYFGGYETSIVKSESDITWFNLTGNGFWEINATNVFYGDSQTSLGVLEKAIIDTGASIAYIPQTILNRIISATNMNCDISSGLFVCKCKGVSDFKDLYFGFGTDAKKDLKVVKVHADNYVLYEGGECLILISDSEEPLLGDSFLRDIYIIHDITG